MNYILSGSKLVSMSFYNIIMFVVSNVRNPSNIILRDSLIISKLFFVLQYTTFYSLAFAA